MRGALPAPRPLSASKARHRRSQLARRCRARPRGRQDQASVVGCRSRRQRKYLVLVYLTGPTGSCAAAPAALTWQEARGRWKVRSRLGDLVAYGEGLLVVLVPGTANEDCAPASAPARSVRRPRLYGFLAARRPKSISSAVRAVQSRGIDAGVHRRHQRRAVPRAGPP